MLFLIQENAAIFFHSHATLYSMVAAGLVISLVACGSESDSNDINNGDSELGQILFESSQEDDFFTRDIIVTDTEGQNLVNLTNGDTSEEQPAWSPDKSEIAYSSLGDIFVIDVDGENPRNLTDSTRDDTNPRWSPDGNKIVFVSDYSATSLDDGEIRVIDVDGSNDQILFDSDMADTDPAWSPDGNKIAFASWRDGPNADIFIIDADGNNPENLTEDKSEIHRYPAWSPDGTKIAYSMRTQPSVNHHDLFVMDADGNNPQVLADTEEEHDKRPTWSPQGDRIAFISDRDETRNLFIIDADGENLENLTDSAVSHDWPDWAE